MKLRYLDIMNSRIPAKLGVCPDGEELRQWTSSFESRALAYGRWWGSTQLTQFCVTESGCGGACIVLPRQVAVIEAANLNGEAMGVQGTWGQFLRPHLACDQLCGSGSSASSNLIYNPDVGSPIFNPDAGGYLTNPDVGGTGSSSGSCGCCGCGLVPQMEDQGLVPTFNVTSAGDYIKLYATNIADYGKKVVVQGKDSNGVWVRSTIDGVVQDGEQVVLAAGGVLTTNTWAVGSPYAVYKEATSYKVLMFAVNATDSSERQLADYEPTETNPSYRKMRIPWMRRRSCSTSGCSTRQTVRAIVSLQAIPITGPNDWLMFADALPAYSDGIMAEKLYENLDTPAGDSYFFGNPRPSRNARGVLRHSVGQGALGFLESLLRKQTGDRTTVRVKRDGLSLAGFV